MRKPFIQSLGLLLAGVMLLAMAGCSALDNFISPSDWQAKGKGMLDNRKTTSDSDVKQPERIDILIEALDKKDAAQFKSVFSETALELADDMDRGIEYIFGLYRGSYVKTVYQNYSSTHSYGEENTVCVDSVYVIQTTENFYRICYTVWTVQEKNPRSVGIYSLFLEECEEDKRGAGGGDCQHYDLARRGKAARRAVGRASRQTGDRRENSRVCGGIQQHQSLHRGGFMGSCERG